MVDRGQEADRAPAQPHSPGWCLSEWSPVEEEHAGQSLSPEEERSRERTLQQWAAEGGLGRGKWRFLWA